MNIKKILCLSTAGLALLLTGCNVNPSSSSSSSSSATSSSFSTPVSISSSTPTISSTLSSSTSSSSNTTGSVNYGEPKSISELSEILEEYSTPLEGDETSSATRDITQVTQETFDIKTTKTHEDLVAYDAPSSLIHGIEDITYVSTDDFLDDSYEGFKPKHREYDYFRGVYGDGSKYYEILDVEGGKEDDTAEKYNVGTGPDKISLAQIKTRTTLTASYVVDYYLVNYMGTAVAESSKFTPTTDSKGNYTYTIDAIDVASDDSGVTNTTASLELTLTPDNFLVSYAYTVYVTANYYDDNGNLSTQEYFVESLEDMAEITRGERSVTPEVLPIIPTDYWMQSYDIGIIADNISYADEKIECSADNIPAGYYITPVAINVFPEKAIDTELLIVENSDNEVINLSEYGVYKSVKGGTTTLSVVSVGGIEKNIELTVVEQSIESIEFYIYSSHYYVGSSYTIYAYPNLGNAIDEIEYSVDRTDLAEIEIDEQGYAMLVCKKPGTVNVTLSSKNNPSASTTKSFTITEKLDYETLKNLLVTTDWVETDYNNQTIIFNDDGTGSFSDSVHTYAINWSYSESLSSNGDLVIYIEPFDYFDILSCVLSADGTTVDVNFSYSELWSYAYKGTFVSQH